MENSQQKPESKRIQAILDGRSLELFNELSNLLQIGDTAIVRTLIIEFGPVKIADLKKRLTLHENANPSVEVNSTKPDGTCQ